MELEIFDQYGKTRRSDSFKPDELAALSPARRKVFDHLRDAAQTLERTERSLAEAEAQLHAAVKTRAAAFENLKKVKPQITPYMAWVATFHPERLKG